MRYRLCKCNECKVPLVETSASKRCRGGSGVFVDGTTGPLAELRCPKCKVKFYIDREVITQAVARKS